MKRPKNVSWLLVTENRHNSDLCDCWSICMSALSVRMYQRGSRWTDFPELLFWELVRKSFEKFKIWLKSEEKYGAFYMKI